MEVPVVTEVMAIPEEQTEGVVDNVLGLDENVSPLPGEEKGGGMVEERAQCSEVRPEVSLMTAEEGVAPEVAEEEGEALQEESGEELCVPSGVEEVERSVELEEEAVEQGGVVDESEKRSEAEGWRMK